MVPNRGSTKVEVKIGVAASNASQKVVRGLGVRQAFVRRSVKHAGRARCIAWHFDIIVRRRRTSSLLLQLNLSKSIGFLPLQSLFFGPQRMDPVYFAHNAWRSKTERQGTLKARTAHKRLAVYAKTPGR